MKFLLRTSIDFRTIGWCDDEANFYVQFPLYDIKNNLREFVFDFMVSPFDFFLEKIRQKFGKGVDWNSKFNLRPDPILPISEITKMDETLGAFLPFSEGAGIEKLQEDICNIQLIPSVPEDVKKVFRHAKNLHIYGWFRYNFFAIAQHYAYLALESAIKNRYYQSFGKENTLENEKGETVRVGRIDHQIIMDFCRRAKGWNVRRLKINGEKFAFDTGELLGWLVKRGIITEWERKQCDKGMRLRHLMSHLTRAYVFPPGYSVKALEFVADPYKIDYPEKVDLCVGLGILPSAKKQVYLKLNNIRNKFAHELNYEFTFDDALQYIDEMKKAGFVISNEKIDELETGLYGGEGLVLEILEHLSLDLICFLHDHGVEIPQ